MKRTIKEIREIADKIDGGLRVNGEFYFVDCVDTETETIFAFQIDDDCKFNYEFTFKDLANKDVELYKLDEVSDTVNQLNWRHIEFDFDTREIIRNVIYYFQDRNYLTLTKDYLVDLDDLFDDFENLEEY